MLAHSSTHQHTSSDTTTLWNTWHTSGNLQHSSKALGLYHTSAHFCTFWHTPAHVNIQSHTFLHTSSHFCSILHTPAHVYIHVHTLMHTLLHTFSFPPHTEAHVQYNLVNLSCMIQSGGVTFRTSLICRYVGLHRFFSYFPYLEAHVRYDLVCLSCMI